MRKPRYGGSGEPLGERSRAADGGRSVTAGLLGIGLVMLLGVASDMYLPAVVALAAIGLLLLVVGSAYRLLLTVLGLHICINIVTLARAAVFVGPFRIRADIVLMGMVVLLWLASKADRQSTGIAMGLSGRMAAVMTALTGIAFLRGMLGQADPELVVPFTYSYGGYLLFFPALWALSRTEGSVRWLVRMLVVFGGIAGLVFLLTGITGQGAGLYYRATGMRIATRQPNAMAVILIMLSALLWKSPRSAPPLLVSLPASVLMAAGILLSQTRALWVALAASFGIMFLVSLFKREKEVSERGRQLLSMAIFGVLIGAGILLVGSLNLLSAQQLAQRGSAGSGSLLFDVSLISRFLSWGTVIDKMQGVHLFLGYGFGETITYFKPEMGMVWTMAFVDGSLFQTALNMGLVGVFALVLLYLAGIVDAARLFLRTSDPERGALALGVMGGLLVVSASSLTGSPATNYRYTVLWAVLFALVRYLRHREEVEAA